MDLLGLWENRQLFWLGFLFTLRLTVLTVVSSTLLGLLVALLRISRVPVLSQLMRVYLEIFRGSPLLIQILFVYFGAAFLSRTGGLSVLAAVTIALTLYQGAYISEVFRAGFESVPPGQREAARALGLSRFSVTVDVVTPQTFTVVLAPLFGQYIGLVKSTALASVIGYADLVRQAQGIIDRIGSPFLVYGVVALLYFVISFPMSLGARHFENRTLQKGSVAT